MSDFPQCGIRMGRFAGTMKTADLLENRQVAANVFRLLAEADAFLDRHKPPVTLPAVRSALANALRDGDYSAPNRRRLSRPL